MATHMLPIHALRARMLETGVFKTLRPLAVCLGLFGAIAAPQADAVTSKQITTVAGTVSAGFSGDGSTASAAQLNFPFGIAHDSEGNLYIADQRNHRVRRVAKATGLITTVAGDGQLGSEGDGAAATSAQVGEPAAVALDSSGNLYIAQPFGVGSAPGKVRRVDKATGLIQTLSVGAQRPTGLALDQNGNLYVADQGNSNVYRRDAVTGATTVVAGSGSQGFAGDGGPAASAKLSFPAGLAFDRNGNLLIADQGNHRVRRVDAATGVITTIAGSGSAGLATDAASAGDGGPATSARINAPSGLAVDVDNNLYVSEFNGQHVRVIDAATSKIRTVAGIGVAGDTGDNGPALSAKLSGPAGLALNAAGDLLIADYANSRVRMLSKAEINSLLAVQDAWWGGAAENGWGLNLTQHGETLVAGWYVFGQDNQPTYLIMQGGTWDASFTTFTGPLIQPVSGAPFSNYDPAAFVAGTPAGTMSLAFNHANGATLSYTVNGVSGTKSISRLQYGSGSAAVNPADVWCGGLSQNGWGLAIAQQGSTLVAGWYTFGANGKPAWYILNGGAWLNDTTYRGPLITATGSPVIGSTYDKNAFVSRAVGEMTLTFTGTGGATMTYTVDGVTQSKEIGRLAF